MASLPIEGKHNAALAGQIVIYQAESGATCAAIPVKLTDSQVAWSGKHTQTIVKSDGQVQERRVKEMTQIFGDPQDPNNRIYRFDGDPEMSISEIPGAAEIVFEIDGEHKEIQPQDGGTPYTVFAIKWLNPFGGGVVMPTAMSRKDFMALHGNKFRAFGLTGAAKPAAKVQPVQPAAAEPAQPAAAPVQPELAPAQPAKKPGRPPKTPAPAKPAAPPATPSAAPTTATLEECWETLQNLRKDLAQQADGEQQLQDLWFAAQKEIAGRQDNELTATQWGQVKAKFETEFAK